MRERAPRVHYIDEGQGPAVVMFHGNPTRSFLYRKVIKELRGRFRCIAMDYPGFGFSERPSANGYKPAEHARVVGKLVDDLSLDKFISGRLEPGRIPRGGNVSDVPAGIGRLRSLALVTSVLMTGAAICETLGYVLYTLDHPGISFQPFLPITLIGAVPFLLTATLIILAARGPRTAGGHRSQASVIRLRMVSGFGLVPIAVGGFWSGIGLGFLGIESKSGAAVALFIYQFIFLAAVLADLVLLIVAFRVRSRKEETHG